MSETNNKPTTFKDQPKQKLQAVEARFMCQHTLYSRLQRFIKARGLKESATWATALDEFLLKNNY